MLAADLNCQQRARQVLVSERTPVHHRSCLHCPRPAGHQITQARAGPKIWTRPDNRRRVLTVKADSTDDSEARQEALLERREKAARRKRDSSNYRQLQAQQQANRQAAATGKPRWPEGQLFPDGWEQMGVFGKAWQLYAGDRGLLFWANKLAFGAIFAIIGGWILFRFVGPATGLYQLTNDISTPSKF